MTEQIAGIKNPKYTIVLENELILRVKSVTCLKLRPVLMAKTNIASFVNKIKQNKY